MEAIELTPESIGAIDIYSTSWITLCTALGYDAQKPPRYLTIAVIKIKAP